MTGRQIIYSHATVPLWYILYGIGKNMKRLAIQMNVSRYVSINIVACDVHITPIQHKLD